MQTTRYYILSHARWRASWWFLPDGFPHYLLCLNEWLMWWMFMWLITICFQYNVECCLNLYYYPAISRWIEPWWFFPDGFPRYFLCLNEWLMWWMFMWLINRCFCIMLKWFSSVSFLQLVNRWTECLAELKLYRCISFCIIPIMNPELSHRANWHESAAPHELRQLQGRKESQVMRDDI